MEQIQDGTGKGYLAKVDTENRLLTSSITSAREEHASESGFSYNINTGVITLTNATITPVLYIKNNEEYDLIITSLIYQTGASANASGTTILVDVQRNPTTISFSTAVEMNINRNFGSSRTLSVTAYKGATGATMSGGTKAFESILAVTTQRIAIATGAITLPRGSSIGINFTAATGNTSQAVEFAVACFLNNLTGE